MLCTSVQRNPAVFILISWKMKILKQNFVLLYFFPFYIILVLLCILVCEWTNGVWPVIYGNYTDLAWKSSLQKMDGWMDGRWMMRGWMEQREDGCRGRWRMDRWMMRGCWMVGWMMRGLGMDGGSENRWSDGREDGRQRGWMYGRLDVWMMRG